ncbi:unnamed protein product [Caenorhabditis angaria]|uniref:Protein kinase domain-containing protein n=1 Tax=Caenorhabditis angaria TaxID=860376 RepID=A0A9P1I7L4_9PELO|nr:unnamed protein product [Caenorhabditis angaria]
MTSTEEDCFFNINCEFETKTNKYNVEKLVGKGGFGEVYKIRNQNTGQSFAMKLENKGERKRTEAQNGIADINFDALINEKQSNFEICGKRTLGRRSILHYNGTSWKINFRIEKPLQRKAVRSISWFINCKTMLKSVFSTPCSGELIQIMRYIDNLCYEDSVNYESIYETLRKACEIVGGNIDESYHWE